MMAVLAAATVDEVTDFIKVLYVAVAGLASEQVSKKLLSDMTAWLPKANKVAGELGSPIVKDIVQFAKTGEIDEDKLALTAKAMRIGVKTDIQKDPHIPQNLVDMLTAASIYLMSRNQNKLASLTRLVTDLDEPNLAQAFVVGPQDQKSFVKPLQKIVKVFTGRNDAVLTAEESKALKAKKPELHAEYLRLRKEFNLAWRTELRNYVFESGKKAIDYKKAVAYLEGRGMKHTLPVGFEGLIDGNGKIYTSAGKMIKTMPGPGFSVKMNPDYDPKLDDQYVFTTVSAEGTGGQHVYTVAYSKAKTEQKFEKVHKLMASIEAIRKKWLPFVKKSDKSPQCVASTMLEIVYQYSARIGSVGNSTGGKETFGLSTLLVKNLKLSGNKAVLAYPGKDAVPQKHVIDGSSALSKVLVSNLSKLADGKDAKEALFTYVFNDKEQRMSAGSVNKWFTKLGAPKDVTVHKMRHVKGTQIFEALLEEHKDKIFNPDKPLTQANADAVFKKLATAVGAQLGHVRGMGTGAKVTPSTAIQNYIDPGLMVSFYVRQGLRPPKMLAKFL
jgi:hypothetical protein